LASFPESFDQIIDMVKLSITIRMRGAFPGLGIGLQTKAHITQ
jgi:hypothetical protein